MALTDVGVLRLQSVSAAGRYDRFVEGGKRGSSSAKARVRQVELRTRLPHCTLPSVIRPLGSMLIRRSPK